MPLAGVVVDVDVAVGRRIGRYVAGTVCRMPELTADGAAGEFVVGDRDKELLRVSANVRDEALRHVPHAPTQATALVAGIEEREYGAAPIALRTLADKDATLLDL